MSWLSINGHHYNVGIDSKVLEQDQKVPNDLSYFGKNYPGIRKLTLKDVHPPTRFFDLFTPKIRELSLNLDFDFGIDPILKIIGQLEVLFLEIPLTSPLSIEKSQEIVDTISQNDQLKILGLKFIEMGLALPFQEKHFDPMKKIKTMKNLKQLVLYDFTDLPYIQRPFPETIIEEIGEMKGLESLDLTGRFDPGTDLSSLLNLEKLEYLGITGLNYQNSFFDELINFESLHRIGFRYNIIFEPDDIPRFLNLDEIEIIEDKLLTISQNPKIFGFQIKKFSNYTLGFREKLGNQTRENLEKYTKETNEILKDFFSDGISSIIGKMAENQFKPVNYFYD